MVLFPEALQKPQRFLEPDLGPPASVLLDLGVIGDIDQLIADAALIQHTLHRTPGQQTDLIHEFKQRDGILRAAAYVVNLSPGNFNILARGFKGAKQIVHAEHVADLAAIAINYNRLFLQSRIDEEGQPSL